MTLWVAKDPKRLQRTVCASSKDSDQPAQPHLSLCWTRMLFVGNSVLRLSCDFEWIIEDHLKAPYPSKIDILLSKIGLMN